MFDTRVPAYTTPLSVLRTYKSQIFLREQRRGACQLSPRLHRTIGGQRQCRLCKRRTYVSAIGLFGLIPSQMHDVVHDFPSINLRDSHLS